MKKHLLTLTTLLFTALLSQAQTIPNGDFENWTSQTTNTITYSKPIGWLDYDSALLAETAQRNITVVSYTPSVTKVAGYGTGYAAQITNNTDVYSNATVKDQDTVLPGLIGVKFPTAGVYPTTLTGYYQFYENNAGTDTATILVELWESNSSVGDAHVYITSNTSGYTSFSITLNYNIGATPDSIGITIASGNVFNGKAVSHAGTYITVDELSLSGTVTGIAGAQGAGAVMAYPNPVTDVINFSNLPAAASLVEISDVTGRPVLQSALPATVNVSALKSGVYIYSISASDGTTLSTSRFVK